jgi:hypothetical protein
VAYCVDDIANTHQALLLLLAGYSNMKFAAAVLFLILPGSLGKESTGLLQSTATGSCWQIESTYLTAPDVADFSEARTHYRPRICNMSEPMQHFVYDDQALTLKVGAST